jgi:hypothetical protein
MMRGRDALAQLDLRAGRQALGRSRLQVLEKDAQGKGFGLNVKKAKLALCR